MHLKVRGPWALLLAFCVGCGSGGPDIATVEGTVTMDGKPLPNASVLFVPEGGRPAGALTDADGHYVLNFTSGRQGAIPGKNIIRISTQADPSEDADGNAIPASPETVPSKYNAKTTLTFDVKPGEENVADFALDSKGPIIRSGGY